MAQSRNAPRASLWRDAPQARRRSIAECERQLSQQALSRYEQRLAALNPVARWLHTSAGVSVVASLYLIGAVLAFGFGSVDVLFGLTLALLLADWHNVTTFHGLIPWRAWFYAYRTGAWVLVVCLILVGVAFVPAVYAIQAYRAIPRIRALRQAQVDARIAELERDVFAPLPIPDPDEKSMRDMVRR